jgi:hypothetical protein
MSYERVLDEAIGQAPPTSIDVDAIVARTRRRMRRERAGGVVVAVAVVGSLVVAGLSFAHHQPTAPADASVLRPDAAIRAALPPVTTWWSASAVFNQHHVYDVNAVVRVGSQSAVIGIKISDGPLCPGSDEHPMKCATVVAPGDHLGRIIVFPDPDIACPGGTVGTPVDGSCLTVGGPHGEKIATYLITVVGVTNYEVVVTRTDGTIVQLDMVNRAPWTGDAPTTGATPPLTIDQLITIGLNPALTLR